MKKISVKDIKNGMSRKEMRNIKGGCGSGWPCNSDSECPQGVKCCIGHSNYCNIDAVFGCQ